MCKTFRNVAFLFVALFLTLQATPTWAGQLEHVGKTVRILLPQGDMPQDITIPSDKIDAIKVMMKAIDDDGNAFVVITASFSSYNWDRRLSAKKNKAFDGSASV